MRWIVATLVIINILVFGYFQLFAKTSASLLPVSSGLSNNATLFQTVTLLSELSERNVLNAVAAANTAPAVVSSVTSGQPICTLVGPFSVLLRAEYFVERLQALSLLAEVKQLVVASEPGYWLYLPSEPSRKEALRRLSELQRRGIDSYVIPSGNLANGISLGMFTNKERADAMLLSVKSQGYKPEIAEVPREQKEIWVFLSQGEAAKLSDERWSELLSSEDYLQKRQNFCSDVASS